MNYEPRKNLNGQYRKSSNPQPVYTCFEGFMNDLYSYFYEREELNPDYIQSLIIKNFSKDYSGETIAKLMCVCPRTVRLIKRRHGL